MAEMSRQGICGMVPSSVFKRLSNSDLQDVLSIMRTY